MSLARNRSYPEPRPSSQPQQRAVMEFVGHRGSSAGAAGLLVVPSSNYVDLDVDVDDDDEDVVIGIRPKSSPQPRRKTSVEEDSLSDISEPPSLSGSRRVSFADAVGLSLVQIKEFDKWDVPQLPDFLDSISKDQEEYFISPFNFPLSLSSEEVAAKVSDTKVELESIELLPETTILKGVVRVLNISFTKALYVRVSLDNWVSHFDLLSEYIPGSSDGQTDSFSFKLTLVPPFAERGARVDFCLRYETPCGTFWSNNSNRNYVLFCYKRKKEAQDKSQKENVKKSCLKAVSPSFSVEESMSSPERENDAADVTTRQINNNECQPKQSINSPAARSDEDRSTSHQDENRRNRSRRNRRKAARAARVRDYFSQRDPTTEDSDTQPSPIKQPETAQEQNISGKHSECKGSIQLEGNAEASMSNDSNSAQHEKLNLTDAAISADESEDLTNTAHSPHQNINKCVSSSSEERSPAAASDCARLSQERADSEKLVSDSGGFAFGTVVAPLYHQVSCRVGGQAHSETCCSTSTKLQRDGGEGSGSAGIKKHKDYGLCCDDEKVESIAGGRAMMDIVEMRNDAKEHQYSAEINCIDSQHAEANIMPEKILDHEKEIHDVELSLDHQVTSAHDTQPQLFQNVVSQSSINQNKDETVLETVTEGSPTDLGRQPWQCDNFSDLDNSSLVNNVEIVALCRGGGQAQGEICHSERRGSGETKDCKDNGLCSDNENFESTEEGRAMMDVVDVQNYAKELNNNAESNTFDSQDVETNIISDSKTMNNLIDNLLNPSEKILDHEREILDVELCLDHQVTSAHEDTQVQLVENVIAQSCTSKNETVLETVVEGSPPDFDQQPCQCDNFSDLDDSSLENNIQIVASSPSNTLIHEENQKPQYECVEELESFCNNTDELSFCKSLATALEGLSGKSQIEKVPLSLQLSQNECCGDQFINITDATKEPGVDDDKSLVLLSPKHVSTECNDGRTAFSSVGLQKNAEDESSNVIKVNNEISLDSDASIVLPSHLSTVSFNENPYLASGNAKNVALADQQSMRQVFEVQMSTLSTTSKSETSEEKSLLGENEDLGEYTQIQEIDVKCSSLLLGQNSHSYINDHDYVAETKQLPTITSKLHEENSSLSLALSHNDMPTSPDAINVESNEIVAISQNPATSGGENQAFPDQGSDLAADHKSSKTAASCQKIKNEENPYLLHQISENNPMRLLDQAMSSKGLVNHLFERFESTKTVAVLPNEGGEKSSAHIDLNVQVMTANSDNFMEEKDIPTETIAVQGADEGAISKTELHFCDLESDTLATGSSELSDILSQANTINVNLKGETKNREIRADTENEDINHFILQTNKEEFVEVQSNLVEDVIQVSDEKLDLDSATQSELTKVLNFKSDVEEDSEPETINENGDDSQFQTKMSGLCNNCEDNEGDLASGSSTTNIVTKENELNESVACTMEDFLDSFPAAVSKNVDYEEKEEVKKHRKTDEEERSGISPRKVECNLSAPMNNVQEGFESSWDKEGEATADIPAKTDKSDSLRCSKDKNDCSECAGQVKESKLADVSKYEQASGNDSNSDSESGSEDEMELYMHCLRAVYGQQSSPKATRAEQSQDKEFKRLSVTRGKRLSSSLPSISESVDEEQQCGSEEKAPERVEVQPIAAVLPDSTHKEENASYLWWRESFSCRNILKTMLYAILVLAFLAMACHYDFIACFGLYVISVIWLFFQGERKQT